MDRVLLWNSIRLVPNIIGANGARTQRVIIICAIWVLETINPQSKDGLI
nr:MAG: hypothetical protein H3Bulk422278_000002 [Mitovirus sp.]QDH91511.1 MAG: hypothetical protein H1Bulk29238_000003 [Mitovirus sp.]